MFCESTHFIEALSTQKSIDQDYGRTCMRSALFKEQLNELYQNGAQPEKRLILF